MKPNSKSQIERKELDEAIDPGYMFSRTTNRLLVQIVRGQIDPVAFAKETLVRRGVVTEERMDYWESWTPNN